MDSIIMEENHCGKPAYCPECGCKGSRHSGPFIKKAWDISCNGKSLVKVRILYEKFKCKNAGCSTNWFSHRSATVTRHAFRHNAMIMMHRDYGNNLIRGAIKLLMAGNTLQQVSDMFYAKFGIKLATSTINDWLALDLCNDLTKEKFQGITSE